MPSMRDGQGFILGLAICFVLGMFPAWGILSLFQPKSDTQLKIELYEKESEWNIDVYEKDIKRHRKCLDSVNDFGFRYVVNFTNLCGKPPLRPVFNKQ